MTKLLAQSTKFINMKEVEVAKCLADQLVNQEKGHFEKGNSKEG